MVIETHEIRRTGRLAVLIGCCFWLTPLASEASDPSTRLHRQLERAVEGYAYLTVFDHVTIEIDHEGIVVLGGHVTGAEKRRDLADRVSVVDDVVGVQNDLAVLPASRFDNELRYQIARSIYGSATFWQYAARRNPPIHIVVRHGHVTLAGQVDSEADRVMAGILASNTAAVSLTNALRLRSEVRGAKPSLD